MKRARPEAHACVRCGYNLRGIVDSWRDRWPLRGRCPECGLDFEWRSVLSPRHRLPRWCVEYARSWWRIPWSCLRTVLMAFAPSRFWRAVQMHHPPRWRRFVPYAIGLLVVLYVSYGLANGVERGVTLSRALATGRFAAGEAIQDSAERVLDAIRLKWPGPGWFGRVWMGPVWARLRGTDLTDVLTGRRAAALAVSTAGLVSALLCPLAFVLLPASRRRTRIRPGHLVRIWLYGMPWLAGPMQIVWWVTTIPAAFIPPARPYVYLASLSCVAIPVWWWAMASKHFLRLPHPWAVGAAVVLVPFLVVLAAVHLIDWVLVW